MKKVKAACLLLFDSKDRLVLQKRSNLPHVFFANCWGPIGGAANENETAQECVIRECQEETGWTLCNLNYLFTMEEHCTESVFMSHIEDVNQLHCFEGEDLAVFSLDQIQALRISEYHRAIIEKGIEIKKIMDKKAHDNPTALFYTKVLPPAFGGYVTAGVNLYRVISGFFDVTLVTDETIEVIERLEKKFDLLIFNATYEGSDVFDKLSKLCNRVWSYEHNKYCGKYCDEMAFRFLNSERVLVPSAFLADDILATFDKENISVSVLPLPIDNVLFQFAPHNLGNKIRLCTFCALKKGRCIEKNILLVHALKKRGIDVVYNVFGATPFGGDETYVTKLKEYVVKLGATDYISFLPPLTNPIHVYQKMISYDYYLDLSEHETYGQAKLEAIFSGLGVFMTSHENNRFLLPTCEGCFYDNDIESIADDVCNRIEFARNNFKDEISLRNKYCEFALEHYSDIAVKVTLERIYNELI